MPSDTGVVELPEVAGVPLGQGHPVSGDSLGVFMEMGGAGMGLSQPALGRGGLRVSMAMSGVGCPGYGGGAVSGTAWG